MDELNQLLGARVKTILGDKTPRQYLEERGYKYYEGYGWIKSTRVQEAISLGLISVHEGEIQFRAKKNEDKRSVMKYTPESIRAFLNDDGTLVKIERGWKKETADEFMDM